VPESRAFDIETAIEDVKRHKSPGTDQIPAELIKTRGRKIRSKKHKYEHINSTWNEEELAQEWKESVIVPIYKDGDKTDCSNYGGSFQVCTKFYPTADCYTLACLKLKPRFFLI
jgi:hypothetical protein